MENDADRLKRIARIERFALWLDDRFRIPGTNITFGLDALIGLVPGAGDAVSALCSGYLIAEARRLGVSRTVVARMALNVVIDFAVGAVPLLGDIFDVAFRANRRNLDLLRRHLARRRP